MSYLGSSALQPQQRNTPSYVCMCSLLLGQGRSGTAWSREGAHLTPRMQAWPLWPHPPCLWPMLGVCRLEPHGQVCGDASLWLSSVRPRCPILGIFSGSHLPPIGSLWVKSLFKSTV